MGFGSPRVTDEAAGVKRLASTRRRKARRRRRRRNAGFGPLRTGAEIVEVARLALHEGRTAEQALRCRRGRVLGRQRRRKERPPRAEPQRMASALRCDAVGVAEISLTGLPGRTASLTGASVSARPDERTSSPPYRSRTPARDAERASARVAPDRRSLQSEDWRSGDGPRTRPHFGVGRGRGQQAAASPEGAATDRMGRPGFGSSSLWTDGGCHRSAGVDERRSSTSPGGSVASAEHGSDFGPAGEPQRLPGS
jgi:hypothetical protein